MTPRKRARVPGAGLPERAAGKTATPRRHTAMTADDTTPDRGQESTDAQTPEEFALEAVGMLLNFHRTEAVSAMHRIEERLMAGERPREEDVREMNRAVDGLEMVLVTYISAVTDGVSLSSVNYEEADWSVSD